MEDISFNKTAFWFPGRWIGGTSMFVAPILMLASQVLLVKFDFFYPHQLKAYYEHPILILGVLKGASPFSIICSIGLSTAMLALGKKVLTDGPRPSTKNLVFWPLAFVLITTAMYLFGQAG